MALTYQAILTFHLICLSTQSQSYQALPVVPQLTLYDNPITPNIPIDPLFPPHLQPKQPYHLGEDISGMGKGPIFVGIEDRDPQYYWINCQMDDTGFRFTMRVNCFLVIDPDPQNMSSS